MEKKVSGIFGKKSEVDFQQKHFWNLLISLFGFCLAMLAVVSARPSLPVYEARYLVGLMTLVLTTSVLINQRLRNPYADILHIVFFFFYVVRATTLLLYPLSSDLLNPPLPIGSVSRSTVFLILAFISLVVGCQLFLRRPIVETGDLTPQETSLIKAILWISTLLMLANACFDVITFAACKDVYLGIANSVFAILDAVFDSWRVLILLTPILALYGGLLSSSDRLMAIGNLVLLGGVGIYMGQKSSVLQIILYLLFPLVLKLRSSERVKLTKLMIYSVLIIALAMAGFALGKVMRVVQLNNYGCTGDHSKIEMLAYSGLILDGQASQEIAATSHVGRSNRAFDIMNSLSYRTGYFDFFVEKLSNPAYLEVVTFKQYFMAITDKVTPGFDVFNVPFISRTIYYAHHPDAVPGEMTNSEQITLFGEAGLLFGWGALLYLPFVCWLLGKTHRILHRLAGSSMLAKNLVYLFMLQLFYYWIEGMGLDMLLVLNLLHTGIFMLSVLLLAGGMVATSRLCTRLWRSPRP